MSALLYLHSLSLHIINKECFQYRLFFLYVYHNVVEVVTVSKFYENQNLCMRKINILYNCVGFQI